MKQIILKVPSIVFILLIFTPLILWYLGIDTGFFDIILKTRVLPTLVAAIWSLSLISYMSSESKSDEYVMLARILIVCQVIIEISIPYITYDSPYYTWIIGIELLGFGLITLSAIIITSIVRKVFYARSLWFLFLEVWIIPIGALTLTPDVQKWNKGDKK
ncbi:MAG: hypothetical protein GQ574_28025 [Crocinitomix sp.]|nr:hypothetical protein [Crocinitomix sp.]